MPEQKLISEYIGVASGFLRSTNLENDWNKTDKNSEYIVTPNVSRSLKRICSGLTTKNGQRAYTLIGPYGTGKSAFTVFLCRLLGQNKTHSRDAITLLSQGSTEGVFTREHLRTMKKNKKGYLPIIITARRRPISQLLLEGILDAAFLLKEGPGLGQLISRLQEALEKNYWQDSATIIQFLSDIQKEVIVQGFSGILICVDEAGKTLEYALQDRHGGDVYIFQEIAELANRQKAFPILFLIILHQMFDDYVELSDRTVRNEWAKVQERFQPIQFNESTATTIEIVGQAVQRHTPLPKSIEAGIDRELHELANANIPLPIGMGFKAFEASAKEAWPLHPSVLLAIPYLFRRLAQNERSIFSYLTSMEPFGFQEIIKRTAATDHNFIRLTDIYDYLLENFEVSLSRTPHAKRLLEANDIILSKPRLSKEQAELIRTIALLNILGKMSPLKASFKLLACAVSNIPGTDETLERLRKESVLTYRRLDGTYRVWEGSDVDIHARMTEARRKLQIEGNSLYESLSHYLPPRSMLARRHSLETGAHRYFKIAYVEKINDNNEKMAAQLDGAAGLILVMLPQADHKATQLKIEAVTQSQNRLVIALPRQIDALRGVVEEVACLNWVKNHTEELRDDRVARRELDMRLGEGEQKIAQLLQTLLDPRPAPIGNSCQWFWEGKDRHPRHPVDVTRLLSKACDRIYSQSPKVRNELIARQKISGAATSARRCLMEKMITQEDIETLGIESYPPERSIYESLLHATDIHIYDSSSDKWKFQPPPENNAMNLAPCWALMEKEIFSPQTHQIQLANLFDKLAQVPYGLPHGIHPVLFAAFYIVNQDDMFLYRQNTFIPDVQIAHFELLQKRPDLFTVAGARLEGIRKAVVIRLAKGLKQPAKTTRVVRALFRVLHTLPKVTLNSTQFKDTLGLKLKDCLLQAQSPETLLFEELPAIYGLKPFQEGEKRLKDIDFFFDRLNKSLTSLNTHADHLLNQSRDRLLKKCGLPTGESGWLELEKNAAWMNPRISHEMLTPLFKCIGNGALDNHNPKPAISCVSTHPFEQWTDMDLERFPGLADGIAGQYKKMWRNFGNMSVSLSPAEQEQKKRVSAHLQSQLNKLDKSYSPKAVAEALRELLLKFEFDAFTENRS